MSEHDPVNAPSHYTFGAVEVWDAIEAWGWGDAHFRACVVKYVVRAGRKNPETELEDLLKARQYLDRLIAKLSAQPREGSER